MTKLISALPRFYAINEHLTNTFRVGIQLEKPVDGEILRHAVDTAIRRYPYFSVKTAVENEEYVLFFFPMMPLWLSLMGWSQSALVPKCPTII